MSWGIGSVEATPVAMVFGVALAVLLGRIVRELPRRLDPDLPCLRADRHRRCLAGLLLVSPLFAAACVWLFATHFAAALAIVFVLVLLALAWIDAETGLLPDLLTLPLLWLGLLANLNGTFVPLHDAVLGAVAGYLVLWIIYWSFLLCTGREGLGHGDFKLLAALGAWLGWAALPWVLLAASSLALAAAVALRIAGRMKPGDALGFGPYLAGAGIVALFAAAAGFRPGI